MSAGSEPLAITGAPARPRSWAPTVPMGRLVVAGLLALLSVLILLPVAVLVLEIGRAHV